MNDMQEWLARSIDMRLSADRKSVIIGPKQTFMPPLPKCPDLSRTSTDALLAELRRRIDG